MTLMNVAERQASTPLHLQLWGHYLLIVLPSLLLAATGLAGCSTQTVKTTAVTPLVMETGKVAEDDLLDIGVAIFEPGLDNIPHKREELTFADVRMAETQYVSWQLAQTLQSSGSWGVVRVNPGDLSSTDVAVHGTILQSDGETMVMKVSVKDATGKTWFEREYHEEVGKYSYEARTGRKGDAFQGLYNHIANDIQAYRSGKLGHDELLNIRTVSRLQFARSFSPQTFEQYLTTSGDGRVKVKRLPATDDPMLKRIDNIRERDGLYVDALQDYYSNYAHLMQQPYNDFRARSYEQVIKYDELRSASTRNMVLGVAAILGGLAVAANGNSVTANNVGIGALLGGGYLIKDAFDKRDESQMHAESLAELGNSLGSEIAPHTIELDEHVVTLSGTVQQQYDQWRKILTDLYAAGLQGATSTDTSKHND